MTAVYCTDICWYEMLVTSHQLQDCGPGTGYGGLASGLVQLSQAIFAKSKYQLPRLAKSYCRYQRQHGTTTPVSWGGKSGHSQIIPLNTAFYSKVPPTSQSAQPHQRPVNVTSISSSFTTILPNQKMPWVESGLG